MSSPIDDTTTGVATHARVGGWVARRFPLFAALRFRDFRLFWTGLLSQIIGQQMMQITLGWLAFDLTGSSATLGLVNMAGAVPRVAFTLMGGVLADRWDARKLISVAQALSAAVMLTLATLTVSGLVEVWHLAAAAFFVGVSQSIDEPARTAFFPKLLPDRSHIPSAVPLISMAWSTTRIVAPSVAGFVIAAAGAGTSFFLSAVGAVVMVTVMRMIRPRPGEGRPAGNMLHNLLEGMRYVRRNEVFFKITMAGFVHGGFAMGYIFMLPVFAKDVLSVDARGLGALASAAGVGSIIGLFTFNWLHAKLQPGKVIIYGLTLFSVSLIGFALSQWFWLSLSLMAITGAAHIYFQTSSQVVLQTLVHEEVRGRVMSLYGMLWSLVLVGGAGLNLVAEFTGPRLALTGGTTVVLLYVWLVVARSAEVRNLSLPRPDPAGSQSR